MFHMLWNMKAYYSASIASSCTVGTLFNVLAELIQALVVSARESRGRHSEPLCGVSFRFGLNFHKTNNAS